MEVGRPRVRVGVRSGGAHDASSREQRAANGERRTRRIARAAGRRTGRFGFGLGAAANVKQRIEADRCNTRRLPWFLGKRRTSMVDASSHEPCLNAVVTEPPLLDERHGFRD
ncbi:hypothetical protein [Burkholderia pseudomallei]|uniref:hypothetical protein n=1 Tax=Burkholderia pseudomallei TaxID=28450 RepID=UPI001FCBD696